MDLQQGTRLQLPDALSQALFVVVDPGTELGHTRSDTDLTELVLTNAGAGTVVRIEAVLGAATGYWHPQAGAVRTLEPDWAGSVATSLVAGAPTGCLFDAAGTALFGFAADEMVGEVDIDYGVSEERKSFAVELRTHAPGTLRLALYAGQRSLVEAVGRLALWMADTRGGTPFPVPPAALEPVYSTWYTFTQDLSADVLEAEAVLAARVGCGSFFIDDGWQQEGHGRGYGGCGDWLPDEAKFPNFRAHVKRLHELGHRVVIWIAPLLIGPRSAAYADLERFAPRGNEAQQFRVLDPRYAEVREHLVRTCLRLVEDYGVHGLKIDFLDRAMVYHGTPSAGDLDDVGTAMAAFLGELRERLTARGHGQAMIEFRQPYVSPAVARYGNILRASDCPADSVVNRRSTIDARLLQAGQVVHSDPMMWSLEGGPAAVAQQLYAGLFSVPQISMRLQDLPDTQAEALRAGLALWRRLHTVLLGGRLEVASPELCYPLIRSSLGLEQVVAVFAPMVVDLDPAAGLHVTAVNATPSDRLVFRVERTSAMVSATTDALGHRTLVDQPCGPDVFEVRVPPFGVVRLRLAASQA